MGSRIGAIVAIALGALLAGTAAFGVASIVGQSPADVEPVTNPVVTYGTTSET
jgi:hypothetical protein